MISKRKSYIDLGEIYFWTATNQGIGFFIALKLEKHRVGQKSISLSRIFL
ncbi:MAG: hypothetical protein ACKO96_47440 [Flammeovirgaceae bacterium]